MVIISILDIHVDYTVRGAADIVKDSILERHRSAVLVDEYSPCSDPLILVQVFDKFYMRNGSRASLSVMYTSEQFGTSIHAVGSGGSQTIFSTFDFGATNDFIKEVEKAFERKREL